MTEDHSETPSRSKEDDGPATDDLSLSALEALVASIPSQLAPVKIPRWLAELCLEIIREFAEQLPNRGPVDDLSLVIDQLAIHLECDGPTDAPASDTTTRGEAERPPHENESA